MIPKVLYFGMKKITAIAFLVLLNGVCKAQNDYDSLKKYSYLLVGIKTQNGGSAIYPIGTCFFSRNSNRLFFNNCET